MKKTLLDYYMENHLSPTRQNIEDMETHYTRRKKLYRQCGIPEIAFRDAEILEVGPGGGYNTLAFFHWNCGHVDLVEANPMEIENMKLLFEKEKINESKYDIFNCAIENYNANKKYDIVVIEGVLTTLDNREEILDKLKGLINEKGIIVVTCTDKIDYFVERIKKLVGAVVVQNIPTYEEKLKYLTNYFRPQLEKLRGMSTLPEDWVVNNMLSPIEQNDREWSLKEAIRYMENEFDILGSSPQMFTDYSWYKDIWYDYANDYLEQFNTKRLSLLLANMQEVILPIDSVKILVKCLEDIIEAETEYERLKDIRKVSDILKIMDYMESNLQSHFGERFMAVFYEIKDILLCLKNGEDVIMENYPNFFEAFGRTQQYISFVKK